MSEKIEEISASSSFSKTPSSSLGDSHFAADSSNIRVLENDKVTATVDKDFVSISLKLPVSFFEKIYKAIRENAEKQIKGEISTTSESDETVNVEINVSQNELVKAEEFEENPKESGFSTASKNANCESPAYPEIASDEPQSENSNGVHEIRSFQQKNTVSDELPSTAQNVGQNPLEKESHPDHSKKELFTLKEEPRDADQLFQNVSFNETSSNLEQDISVKESLEESGIYVENGNISCSAIDVDFVESGNKGSLRISQRASRVDTQTLNSTNTNQVCEGTADEKRSESVGEMERVQESIEVVDRCSASNGSDPENGGDISIEIKEKTDSFLYTSAILDDSFKAQGNSHECSSSKTSDSQNTDWKLSYNTFSELDDTSSKLDDTDPFSKLDDTFETQGREILNSDAEEDKRLIDRDLQNESILTTGTVHVTVEIKNETTQNVSLDRDMIDEDVMKENTVEIKEKIAHNSLNGDALTKQNVNIVTLKHPDKGKNKMIDSLDSRIKHDEVEYGMESTVAEKCSGMIDGESQSEDASAKKIEVPAEIENETIHGCDSLSDNRVAEENGVRENSVLVNEVDAKIVQRNSTAKPNIEKDSVEGKDIFQCDYRSNSVPKCSDEAGNLLEQNKNTADECCPMSQDAKVENDENWSEIRNKEMQHSSQEGNSVLKNDEEECSKHTKSPNLNRKDASVLNGPLSNIKPGIKWENDDKSTPSSSTTRLDVDPEKRADDPVSGDEIKNYIQIKKSSKICNSYVLIENHEGDEGHRELQNGNGSENGDLEFVKPFSNDEQDPTTIHALKKIEHSFKGKKLSSVCINRKVNAELERSRSVLQDQISLDDSLNKEVLDNTREMDELQEEDSTKIDSISKSRENAEMGLNESYNLSNKNTTEIYVENSTLEQDFTEVSNNDRGSARNQFPDKSENSNTRKANSKTEHFAETENTNTNSGIESDVGALKEASAETENTNASSGIESDVDALKKASAETGSTNANSGIEFDVNALEKFSAETENTNMNSGTESDLGALEKTSETESTNMNSGIESDVGALEKTSSETESTNMNSGIESDVDALKKTSAGTKNTNANSGIESDAGALNKTIAQTENTNMNSIIESDFDKDDLEKTFVVIGTVNNSFKRENEVSKETETDDENSNNHLKHALKSIEFLSETENANIESIKADVEDQNSEKTETGGEKSNLQKRALKTREILPERGNTTMNSIKSDVALEKIEEEESGKLAEASYTTEDVQNKLNETMETANVTEDPLRRGLEDIRNKTSVSKTTAGETGDADNTTESSEDGYISEDIDARKTNRNRVDKTSKTDRPKDIVDAAPKRVRSKVMIQSLPISENGRLKANGAGKYAADNLPSTPLKRSLRARSEEPVSSTFTKAGRIGSRRSSDNSESSETSTTSKKLVKGATSKVKEMVPVRSSPRKTTKQQTLDCVHECDELPSASRKTSKRVTKSKSTDSEQTSSARLKRGSSKEK